MPVSRSVLALGFGLYLATMAVAPQAQAALGGKSASVDADRQHLHARMSRAQSSGFTVQDLATDDGTVTREYISSSGVVFAVTWAGPARPDLKQLFGPYYDRFQAANTGKGPGRRPLRADNFDFVVRSGGHSGDFWGFAYLPYETPAGFDLSLLTRGAQ
ncbi:MAG TPA: DUF2844 domain-containing protein [Asticcacaulis sp.]|nr:DUF2844 domain-containing protein [Asticcacaulis sp.]